MPQANRMLIFEPRYSTEQLVQLRRQMLGTLGPYRPDLSGMNAARSPLHCAASLETRRG
jgi:hypothetical protein